MVNYVDGADEQRFFNGGFESNRQDLWMKIF